VRVAAYKQLLSPNAIAILQPGHAVATRNVFLGVPVAHAWPQDRVGVLDLAGPWPDRARLAHEALGRGWRVVIHPPFGSSLAEATALLERSGEDLRVALPVHYTHAYQAVATALTGLGKVTSVRCLRIFPPTHCWQQSLCELLEALTLLGGEIAQLSVRPSPHPLAEGTLAMTGRFVNGALLRGEMSSAYPTPYQKEVVAVVGERGRVEYVSDGRTLRLTTDSNSVRTEADHRPPYERMVEAYLRWWERAASPALPDPLPLVRAFWATLASQEHSEARTL